MFYFSAHLRQTGPIKIVPEVIIVKSARKYILQWLILSIALLGTVYMNAGKLSTKKY